MTALEVFPFHGLDSRELPVYVRLKPQATQVEYATVPGRNSAVWTPHGGPQVLCHAARSHFKRTDRHSGLSLFFLEHLRCEC
jgi:hypothetical protein